MKKIITAFALATALIFSLGSMGASANGETYYKYHYTTVGGVNINGQSAGYLTSSGYGDSWGYSDASTPITYLSATNYLYFNGVSKYSKKVYNSDSTSAFADPSNYKGSGNFKSRTFNYFFHNGSEVYFYTEYSF